MVEPFVHYQTKTLFTVTSLGISKHGNSILIMISDCWVFSLVSVANQNTLGKMEVGLN